jgi:hypothetical protein
LGYKYVYVRSSSNIGDSENRTYAGVFASVPLVFERFDDIFLDVIKEELEKVFSTEALVILIVKYDGFKDYKRLKIALIFQGMKNPHPIIIGHARLLSDGSLSIEMAQGLGSAVMPLIFYMPLREETLSYEDEIIYKYIRSKKDKEINPVIATITHNKMELRYAPQEKIDTIDEKKGWGTISQDCTPLDEEEYKNTASEFLKIFNKVKNSYSKKKILIEFVRWRSGEIDLVQIRPAPVKQGECL